MTEGHKSTNKLPRVGNGVGGCYPASRTVGDKRLLFKEAAPKTMVLVESSLSGEQPLMEAVPKTKRARLERPVSGGKNIAQAERRQC